MLLLRIEVREEQGACERRDAAFLIKGWLAFFYKI
jgi:hypothetical protein